MDGTEICSLCRNADIYRRRCRQQCADAHRDDNAMKRRNFIRLTPHALWHRRAE